MARSYNEIFYESTTASIPLAARYRARTHCRLARAAGIDAFFSRTMRDGNWVPLDKALISFLPKDRPYTYLEAMYSISVDVDNGKENSINGYASLWRWSRCKVHNFIKELKTGRRQVVDRKGTGRGQEVRFIINSLRDVEDRKATGSRQEGDRKAYTTIDPNTKPNPKTKKRTIPDAEFISRLKETSAYRGIDIDRELSKMDAWLLTLKGRHRKKTRRFIVNWLNRVDVGVQSGKGISDCTAAGGIRGDPGKYDHLP